MKAPAANAGFTLVELVITISLVSIALVAVIYGWSMSARFSSDVTWQAKTAYLGQAYLEEVLTKRFDELSTPEGTAPCDTGMSCTAGASFGPESGESRSNYDDVDDYHGLDEVPLTDLAAYFDGTNPYQGYRVQISISYDSSQISTASMVKRILVTVSPPGGLPSAQFSAYRGNY